jgi:hypothetical protein
VLQFTDTDRVDEDWMTIAEAAARCGLPESTLRYWERIGLVNRVRRDASSGHRRYSPEDVATLETLGNLRAVGLSIETGAPARRATWTRQLPSPRNSPRSSAA